jgi:hypothetical protein
MTTDASGLPLARVHIAGPEVITVQLVDAPLQPPRSQTPMTLGHIVDHLWQAIGGPFQIEVIDPMGGATGGVVDLTPSPPPALSTDDAVPAPSGDGPVLDADGFLPGEAIGLALITAETRADIYGRLQQLVPDHMLRTAQGREAIVLGRVSGTLHIHPLHNANGGRP